MLEGWDLEADADEVAAEMGRGGRAFEELQEVEEVKEQCVNAEPDAAIGPLAFACSVLFAACVSARMCVRALGLAEVVSRLAKRSTEGRRHRERERGKELSMGQAKYTCKYHADQMHATTARPLCTDLLS